MMPLLETLQLVEEYFDQRADAQYFTDSPAPIGNEEMGLLVAVRIEIARANRDAAQPVAP